MLDKIFSWSKKKTDEEAEPGIAFGRYSDNNKSVTKVEKWNAADSLFKEHKYFESIAAFFEYLSDEDIQNVTHIQEGNKGTFHFFQGSKIIRGHYNEELFEAITLHAAISYKLLPAAAVIFSLLAIL